MEAGLKEGHMENLKWGLYPMRDYLTLQFGDDIWVVTQWNWSKRKVDMTLRTWLSPPSPPLRNVDPLPSFAPYGAGIDWGGRVAPIRETATYEQKFNEIKQRVLEEQGFLGVVPLEGAYLGITNTQKPVYTDGKRYYSRAESYMERGENNASPLLRAPDLLHLSVDGHLLTPMREIMDIVEANFGRLADPFCVEHTGPHKFVRLTGKP
jgi:hypothetical protein